jgi:hypothetical protein
MSEDDEIEFVPDKVAFPWVIVAFLVGGLFGFMIAASAVPPGCFQ